MVADAASGCQHGEDSSGDEDCEAGTHQMASYAKEYVVLHLDDVPRMIEGCRTGELRGGRCLCLLVEAGMAGTVVVEDPVLEVASLRAAAVPSLLHPRFQWQAQESVPAHVWAPKCRLPW